ncbi:efflux RND transporter periplasmic adaptor subunit [Alkalimonas sp. MEB108]|uniref:Efflux RND transporter periplasmic adaptor subunit n=1 Tax=Alkalimonas cellulosilytica TaxID=3058395 RepID=A0ABU7J950_9GAMM|nr:efflux RND transporter periplasmic adaptor subunit [Alkalimonas sp. MEB108]MEE2003076.1 efflux RND transporter periplasmic adaptor subunit [Alkalimonas sp. MEB108]
MMKQKLAVGRYGVLAIFLLVLLGWFASGELRNAKETVASFQHEAVPFLPQVETRLSQAAAMQPELVLQGQLRPFKQVHIQAQLQGSVEALQVDLGHRVDAGAPLLSISDDGRSERLQQTKALLRLREAELASARQLGASQFLSETELIRLESELASAKADHSHAARQLALTQPLAPFAGQISRRMVELGDFVQAGTGLFELVQTDRLRMQAQIPQQQVLQVQAGQQARLVLLDGRALQGEVHFVSPFADEATRSFLLEVWADNPNGWPVAGASATVHIELAATLAHRLSPALLQLNDEGRLAVSVVEQQQVVRYPVQLLQATPEAVWVTGLPEQVELIQTGAGFVRPGDTVQVQRMQP